MPGPRRRYSGSAATQKDGYDTVKLMAEVDPKLGRLVPDLGLVRERVEKVLRDNYVTSPPVVPFKIATNYGLRVLFTTFQPQATGVVSGLYQVDTNTIYVNTEDPPDRQTFTIAHEFGHALLHKDLYAKDPDRYTVLMRTPLRAETDPLEQEANAFATQLLIPKMFLDKYYQKASIGELARLFVVSEEVIRFRLENEHSAAA